MVYFQGLRLRALQRIQSRHHVRKRLTPTENVSQVLPKMLPADPDLAASIEAWPTLPEAVRASILMLVKAALGGDGE
jgi:hypothetical protein